MSPTPAAPVAGTRFLRCRTCRVAPALLAAGSQSKSDAKSPLGAGQAPVWPLRHTCGGGVALAHKNDIDLEETGVQGVLSPLTASRAGVSRVSLAEAIALGPAAWDAVLSSGPRSPFMSWEWHRAWADAAPTAEAAECSALLVRDADGSLQALLPIRPERVRFRRVPVRALTWAIGDVGCPDELDVAALPDADLSDLAAALDALPWRILILRNLAEQAPNAQRLGAALADRGDAVRARPRCAVLPR